MMMKRWNEVDESELEFLRGSSLEEGVAGVGRVGAPGGHRRWVGRAARGRRLRRGGAHLGLHRVPGSGEDESFEHLDDRKCVV